VELTKDGLLKWKAVGDVAVFTFTRGRIRDEREVLRKLDGLGNYIKFEGGRKIVLDLSNMEYLSSAGVGILVGLLKKSKGGDGALKLCSLQEPIRELFELLRLNTIFEVYPTLDAALASFGTATNPARQEREAARGDDAPHAPEGRGWEDRRSAATPGRRP
jgi:anti-sigma B factor antagonist